MKNMIVRPVVGLEGGSGVCSGASNTPRKAENVPNLSQGQLSLVVAKTSVGTNACPKPLGFVPNKKPQPIATKTRDENFFAPCKKCRSPVFWFSKGGTGPHCVDCEFPAAKQLVKKVCAVEKNASGTFQPRMVYDLPSFGIGPGPDTGEITTNLDADPSQSLTSQPNNQPTDGLLAFLDADGATHIRLARFARDKSLQRQDETRDEYEQRLRDSEQLAKCGDVLKSFYEKANAKK